MEPIIQTERLSHIYSAGTLVNTSKFSSLIVNISIIHHCSHLCYIFCRSVITTTFSSRTSILIKNNTIS